MDETTWRRFWRKIRVEGECWHWEGASGYRLQYQGRPQNAHKVVYGWFLGSVGDTDRVLPTCGHADCLQPAHLEKKPRWTGNGWYMLRRQVFERDGGMCQVCGLDLNATPQYYECGHKVDRVAGGLDDLDNLDTMCNWCNRTKPVHRRLGEYRIWLEGGGSRGDFARYLARQTSQLTG